MKRRTIEGERDIGKKGREREIKERREREMEERLGRRKHGMSEEKSTKFLSET